MEKVLKPRDLNILANRLFSGYSAEMTRTKCRLGLHYFSYTGNQMEDQFAQNYHFVFSKIKYTEKTDTIFSFAAVLEIIIYK